MLRILTVLAALIVSACGGNDDSPHGGPTTFAQAIPIAGAHAATVQAAPPTTITQLGAILRHADDGSWYIQNTDRHWPMGILTQVQVCPKDPGCDPNDRFIRVFMDKTYPSAGTVIVKADDDYGPLGIDCFSNLGVNSITIKVTIGPDKRVIDPSTIRQYAPAGSGNFWILALMNDHVAQ